MGNHIITTKKKKIIKEYLENDECSLHKLIKEDFLENNNEFKILIDIYKYEQPVKKGV